MKVHSPALDAYLRTAVQPAGRPSASPSVSGDTPDMPASQAAHVTISAEARERAVEGPGGVDQRKVDELRQRLDAGTYRVNPQILAMRLLDKLG